MLENANSEFLDINNIKIHTVIMGSEKGKTPILLLHGFPEFFYSYRYIMPLIAKKRKVIAIDQRGFNKSSKPRWAKNYSLKYLMRDVIEVIKQKSSTGKVILVGHDWGGAVAWHVARAFPGFIEKLIILNCPPADLLFRAFKKIPRQIMMSYYMFLFQIPILPELMFKMKNSNLIRNLYKRIKVNGVHIDEVEIGQYVKCFQKKRGASGINYYRAAFRDVLRRRLALCDNVQCPTLVLWGTKDFALHINLTRYFHEYVKKGLLKIQYFHGVSHFIQQEQPALVADEILKFL